MRVGGGGGDGGYEVESRSRRGYEQRRLGMEKVVDVTEVVEGKGVGGTATCSDSFH